MNTASFICYYKKKKNSMPLLGYQELLSKMHFAPLKI